MYDACAWTDRSASPSEQLSWCRPLDSSGWASVEAAAMSAASR